MIYICNVYANKCVSQDKNKYVFHKYVCFTLLFIIYYYVLFCNRNTRKDILSHLEKKFTIKELKFYEEINL